MTLKDARWPSAHGHAYKALIVIAVLLCVVALVLAPEPARRPQEPDHRLIFRRLEGNLAGCPRSFPDTEGMNDELRPGGTVHRPHRQAAGRGRLQRQAARSCGVGVGR